VAVAVAYPEAGSWKSIEQRSGNYFVTVTSHTPHCDLVRGMPTSDFRAGMSQRHSLQCLAGTGTEGRRQDRSAKRQHQHPAAAQCSVACSIRDSQRRGCIQGAGGGSTNRSSNQGEAAQDRAGCSHSGGPAAQRRVASAARPLSNWLLGGGGGGEYDERARCAVRSRRPDLGASKSQRGPTKNTGIYRIEATTQFCGVRVCCVC
jgi:hypothetical protein